ncbi:Lnb N-terminal periplasmic domain-containing protein [Methylomagnum sp.]
MTRRIGTAVALVLAGLAMTGATGWGTLVLYYLAPGPAGLRMAAAGFFAAIGLAALGTLCVRRTRRLAGIGFAAALVPVLLVWGSATPSNDRDWQPEVAVLPYATLDGDRVTVHNIRNFDYRTETDFTPAYYDRTFDLKRLDRVDLLASYWMGPAIAHMFVSFGFGEDHLAISIEVRKDRTRPYATLPGLFRQYELVYVVADERDVIRVRTNYRKDPPEEVYLFRLVGPIENGRRVFLDYMRDINELREHPRFYNTLTTNCTTMILTHAAVNPGHLAYSWKVLLSGYTPEYAYEQGRLNQSLSFEELRERSHINAVARAADQAPDFSRRIRADLP